MLRRFNLLLLLPIPGDSIFRRDVRHVRWYHSAKSLKRQAIVVFLLVFGGLLIIWLLLPPPPTIQIVAASGQNIAYYSYEISARQLVALLIVGVSILANALMDFRSVLSVMNAIRGEITSKRLDLLRLTPIPEANIVDAKHRVAQVRVWRMTILIVSVRLFTPILFFTADVLDGRGEAYFQNLAMTFRSQPIGTLILFLFLIIVFVFFVLEPLWRVQAMTALGIAVSARVENSGLAILTGVLAIFGVWIAQPLILMLFTWIFTSIAVALLGYSFSPLAEMLPYFYTFAFAAIVYWFYSSLQSRSLRRATQAAFAD